MPGLLPARILVHQATPIGYAEDGAPWVEGEPAQAPTAIPEATFACLLFLPGPGGAQNTEFRIRSVSEPLVLYNPTRNDGSFIVVGDEHELLILAPDLAPWTGADMVRWLTVGLPQPFGPPGKVGGLQATLRRVED